jgi:hypothetical protein
MPKAPLRWESGHLYATLDGRDWLLDTGAPSSFGLTGPRLGERVHEIADSYLGLTAERLSELVGHQTSGLLGADVLGDLDVLIDVPQGEVVFSESQLALDGEVIPTDTFLGVPVVDAHVGGRPCHMFFDTGAQLSYLDSGLIGDAPALGPAADFYPGLGEFEVDTHRVELQLGALAQSIRCGVLPETLAMMLRMGDAEGIVGNELLDGRRLGLFLRRGQLVFG